MLVDSEVRTVSIGDTVIGQVDGIWQQKDPYTWIIQWVVLGSNQPLCFNEYDEAEAYLMGMHDHRDTALSKAHAEGLRDAISAILEDELPGFSVFCEHVANRILIVFEDWGVV